MNVLVAYASRNGATPKSGKRSPPPSPGPGWAAESRQPRQSLTVTVSGYDALVIGSAAYLNHWLREATAFAKHHRQLEGRPIWLFSSGPPSSEQVADRGVGVARPRDGQS